MSETFPPPPRFGGGMGMGLEINRRGRGRVLKSIEELALLWRRAGLRPSDFRPEWQG
jgi:hypothetical protein